MKYNGYFIDKVEDSRNQQYKDCFEVTDIKQGNRMICELAMIRNKIGYLENISLRLFIIYLGQVIFMPIFIISFVKTIFSLITDTSLIDYIIVGTGLTVLMLIELISLVVCSIFLY